MGANHPAKGHDAGVQFGHAVGDLRIGHDHQRAGIAAEPTLMRVAHHADDLARGLFKVGTNSVANDDLLADGIFVGEELLRQGLVDERHAGRAGGVLVGELAAADYGNAEELVVIGRGAHPARSRRPLGRIDRFADDGEGQAELALDGEAAGEGGILHAGDGVEALAAIVGELRHAGCLLIARSGQGHFHGDDVVRIKAGVDGVQRDKGADQQRRADEQHNRDQYFDDHQPGREPFPGGCRCRRGCCCPSEWSSDRCGTR